MKHGELIRALESAIPALITNTSQICLIRVLIDYAGMSDGLLAYPSIDLICTKTLMSRRSVQRNLKMLASSGAIRIADSSSVPSAKSNIYDLSPMVAYHLDRVANRGVMVTHVPSCRPYQNDTGVMVAHVPLCRDRGVMVSPQGRHGDTQEKNDNKMIIEEEDARDDHAHHENHPTNHHPLTSDQNLDLPHEDSHDRDHLESGKQPEAPENRSPDPERSNAPAAQGEPGDRDDSGQDDPVKMESWLANKLQLWHKEFSPGGQPPEIYHAQRIVTYAIDSNIFDTNSSVPFCKFIMDRLRDYTDREAVPHTRKAITWLNRDLKEEYKDHAADYAASIATERDRQARLKEAGQERMREQEEAKRREAAEVARRAKSGHLPHYRTGLELDLLKVAISFAASGMVPIGDEVRQDVIDIELVAAANSEYTLNTVTWCELVATCQSLPCWKAAHPGADT